jgi:hypothetical protein
MHNEFKLFRIRYFGYLKNFMMSKSIDLVISFKIMVFYNHTAKLSLEHANLFA